MINEKNYEEWLEGNLNEIQLEVLKQFLDKNPELNEEFKELEFVKLKKIQVHFPDKDMLKKSLDIEKILELSDFEVLAIKKLEGYLSQKEEKELNNILKYNPHLQKEYDLLLGTKLVPKRDIIYGDKQKLKKQPTRVILLWVKYAASIAAMFTLVIFAVKLFSYEKTNQIIVNQDKIETESPIIKTEITNSNNNVENMNLAYDNINRKIIQKELNPKPVANQVKKTQKNTFSKTKGIIDNRLRIELATINKIKTQNVNFSPQCNKNSKIDINRKTIVLTPVKEYENRFAYNNIEALTPKQLFIKKIKIGLDINDKNYDKIGIIPTISAVVNKTDLASIKVEEKNNTREIAFSIGSFSFSRKYRID